MGVAGLSPLLKEIASKRVCLDEDGEDEGGGRHVIVDGHYALHRAGGNSPAAVAMVLEDNIVPLAMSVVHRLDVLRVAGWEITLVFDGRTPPGKANTANSRESARQAARDRCQELKDAGAPLNHPDLEAAAKRAVHFTSFIVARVARVLVHVLRCTCIRAAYESDGQLALLEKAYLKMGRTVLVHGTDSDLMVLGVRSLLWDVTRENGKVFGQIFTQDALTRPQLAALNSAGEGADFLRLLHGILNREAAAAGGDAAWWCPKPLEVMERLRVWACVAGNDYSKFRRIGPKTAMDICLRRVSHPTFGEVGTIISAIDGRSRSEVEAVLERSMCMTLHPVVYCAETGQQQHLSGHASTENITRATGAPANPQMAQLIARGAVCPCTYEPWEEDFPESVESMPVLPPRPLAGRRRRRPAPADTNNFERTGFGRLPTAARLREMTVAQLREFLSPIRCLEQAGTSSMSKNQLVGVAMQVVQVMEKTGLVGSAMAFRTPQQYSQNGALAQPADGWLEWERLRELLPEFAGDAIIIAWLRSRRSMGGGNTGRALYRGLQRMMDLGAGGGLTGIPCGENGGILHLQTTMPASMRNLTYNVRVDVRVERVDPWSASPGDGVTSDHGAGDATASRLVATAVVAAWCECQSGSNGGCHHVSCILQLTRLLALTDAELEMWDPDSPTSRACQWIRQECGSRRGTETDVFHGASLNDIAVALRPLRDPKKVALGAGAGGVAKTAGVVATDRRRDFSSHPDHGVWAAAHQHFDEGTHLSRKKWDLLRSFVDGERVVDSRGDDKMAVDVLPPRLMPDSPSSGMDVTAGQRL